MPEMPEVETVRRTLLPLIKGKTIKEVKLWYPKIIASDPLEFTSQLAGKKIVTIDRYAKYLLLRLSGQLTIVSHLRMEGKYRLVRASDPKGKHDHVQFVFTDGTGLRYNDVRKFGRMQLVKTGTEKIVTGISKLGVEPNSSGFTKAALVKGMAGKNKSIKNALLDQSVVAGLGNIYVDEVLWESKIHPLSMANQISKYKLGQLHDNINALIALAIAERGTTVHTYLDANGQTGGFQKMLRVYGHQGEPCQRCGTPLEKIKVTGRGTTYCPHCQVLYK
ncbi:bifunctional DNA-formamidopyrimidine glycosylase/DNA-(apurinic or apyrimidinic site) lyase [Lactobacillus xylocopicola]|uniref:Formamidopyrimidine-DNA glycosylase n=1 Tax=Lactobacillus xylocopicola TaxID=2976676 RepID=A0ABM8BHK9_9LACO|nr:bifunctional DNA-formamidopyrimidine glycosylase/DNA-(apurinic or apyrimidinic site) lyase [Lactobacillus xylocopicola]BDR60748.1 formamidopyrimidine-DNA glycosylase [Lactobacillus xylocopicola]